MYPSIQRHAACFFLGGFLALMGIITGFGQRISPTEKCQPDTLWPVASCGVAAALPSIVAVGWEEEDGGGGV